MDDTPLEICRQIDKACTEFQRALSAGGKVRVNDYGGRVATEHQPELLKWLVAAEIEHEWQHWTAAEPSATRPSSLGRYVDEHPRLLELGINFRELVRLEFRSRQEFGDRPLIDEAVGRFPEHAEWLSETLRGELNTISPVQITITRGLELHKFLLLRLTEIGRQKHAEPNAVALIELNDLDRLIVADAEERTVARRHLDCDLIARDSVRVRNYSTKSLTAINSVVEVIANDTFVGKPPFVINVGPRIIHIEPLPTA